MKNILIMGGVGVGLFSATVVGLLGAQGRLNYEGTRGIPLVSMLFSPPPVDPDADPAAEGGEGEDPHADPHTDAQPGADEHPTEPKDGTGFGVQHDGLGKEAPLSYSQGKSVFEEGPPPDPHGGGHGDEAGGSHGDAEDHPPAPAGETSGAANADLTPPQTEFQRQMEGLLGQQQYRPGSFFKFPRLEADISVEELNRYLRAAKVALDGLEKRRAKLETHESELDARQRDIEDRERLVADQMANVDLERARLDQRIREFEAQVILVKRDELPALQQYAATLEYLEARQSMEHVIMMWEASEESKNKILKVLASMDSEKVNALLAEVELPKLKDILVERLKVVIEKGQR